MQKLHTLKSQGDAHFKSKQLSKAVTCYEECLTQCNFRIDDIKKENEECLLDESKKL